MLKRPILCIASIFILLVSSVSVQAFIRGDINNDGNVDISDPVYLFNHLFSGSEAPECDDAADVNDDGDVNMADGIYLNNHLFQGGSPPPAPYPDSDVDPTEDDLRCESEINTAANTVGSIRIIDPPNEVCNNEYVDFRVFGSIVIHLNDLTDHAKRSCENFGQLFMEVEIRIYEEDIGFDDLIKELTTDLILTDCKFLNFDETFRVNLGPHTGVTEGDTLEVYAEATPVILEGVRTELPPLREGVLGDDITNYIDILDNCQCLPEDGEGTLPKGPCCTTSRPYKFKSANSQPAGISDTLMCVGTHSPTGQETSTETDNYCSGNDANKHTQSTNLDICGTCQYCTDGDSTCNDYNGREPCDTTECDNRDTECRDYHDVDSVCLSGSCSQQSCNSYTDKSQGTSCSGGSGRCDGAGLCVNCQDNGATICHNNDEYWARVCGPVQERQGLKKDCGVETCGGWSNYCEDDGDLYRKRTCTNRGCSNNQCFSSPYENAEFAENCPNGCSLNRCNPDPNIECFNDNDCPTTYSGNFCSGGHVKKTQNNKRCVNPGTSSSSCELTSQTNIIVEVCENGCSNAQCNSEPPVCTNDCSPSGSTRCLTSSSRQTCGNYDADSCYEWGNNQNCAFGCSNNQCQSQPTEKPDLTVTNFVVQWPTTTTIKVNSFVVLAFTIKNIGKARADNIYYWLETGPTNAELSNSQPFSLDKGESKTFFRSVGFSQTGSTLLKVTADLSNKIAESDETNNVDSITISVV